MRIRVADGPPEPALSPEALLRGLRATDPRARAAAAKSLARLGVRTPASALALLVATTDLDPAVHASALAALAVLVPSTPVVQAAGSVLVSDRFGAARDVRVVLRDAPAETARAALPLLDRRDPLDKRAGLAVLHAARQPADTLVPALLRLVRPGLDTYVRRAAVRVLGQVREPWPELLDALGALGRDWDSGLRAAAACALGQLAARSERVASRYAAAVRRLAADEVPEFAAALREAGEPVPPPGPAIGRLAAVYGYPQLDLADALLAPHRADGATRSALPLAHAERLDDAAETLERTEAPRAAAGFLRAAGEAPVEVRAAALVFAAQLDPSLGVAMALQRVADSDEDEGVRALAQSLLARVGSGGGGGE